MMIIGGMAFFFPGLNISKQLMTEERWEQCNVNYWLLLGGVIVQPVFLLREFLNYSVISKVFRCPLNSLQKFRRAHAFVGQGAKLPLRTQQKCLRGLRQFGTNVAWRIPR
jgi:hypothetical protein